MHDRLEVPGKVTEILPNALYRVELEGERRSHVTAHVSGDRLLRLLPGDAVIVEVLAYDPRRGRILRRRE